MHTQDTRGRQIKQKTQHNFVEHHYKLIIKRKEIKKNTTRSERFLDQIKNS
jgi:hypothetical protein